MELIPEDHLQTFENLEPKELLTLSEASDRFLVVAQNIFETKYSDKTIEISDALPTEEDVFIDRRGVISIDDRVVALNILERFGHLIQKLAIRYSSDDLNEIINSIGLHCADGLIQLEIDSFDVKLFEKFQKPFKNVEILSIVGHFNRVAASNLSFTELFPVLRELSLNHVEINDPKSLLIEIPTLRHVHINAYQFNMTNHLTENQFQDLLRKNSQIESLKLDNGNRELLKLINRIVPKLESLELVNYNPSVDSDLIVFENVENFTISHSLESAPNGVDFPNLVEFHAVDFEEYSNEWIHLVQRSKQLKRIYIGSTSISNEQIEKLANISSNLTDIFIEAQAIIKDETIVKLVRNSRSMEMLFMTFYIDNGYSYEHVAQLLRNEFENLYEINDCEYELIVVRLD